MKGWNMEEVANYAKLVTLGEPDFIEVKGVTYCGSSGASSLTMANVPYHEDVCAFGEVSTLRESLPPASLSPFLGFKRAWGSFRRRVGSRPARWWRARRCHLLTGACRLCVSDCAK